MSDPFWEYDRKRGRAVFHLEAVREQVERLANIEHDPVRGHFNSDAVQYEFHVPLEPFDPDWTLRLGEFAYNARSSLDYLITALVRSTGKEENKCNQFPIYSMREDVAWEAMGDWWDTSRLVTRDLKDTPPGTRAALKPLQPFYGVPVTNPFAHPLNALSLMNNRDKHRRLNLLARPTVVDFVDADGQPIFHVSASTRTAERVEGDTYTVIMSVSPETTSLAPEYLGMDMYALTRQNVALDEPPELIGNLVETMVSIDEFIERRVRPIVAALL